MQLFLIDWRNNYGLDAIVMEAGSEEQVHTILEDKQSNVFGKVWEGYTVTPLVITGIAGTITYTDHQS